MNKYIFCLAAAALSLGFTACEDVPAPYGVNDNKPDTPNPPSEEGVIIDAPLSSNLTSNVGEFTAPTTVGNYPFAIDGSYGYVKVTSYDSESKVNNAAESYLIAPTVSLKDVEKAHVTFDYILRYANSNELKTNYLVRFSTNYAGDPATATWTDVTFNPIQVADWNTWTTADVNVPAAFIGQENVTVALYYKTNAKAATWELKNFKLSKGEAAGNEVDQSTRTLPYSESFATSFGGFKNYTTSGAGEWTIDYSTAKATGWNGTTQVTTAGTYYLVSPEISLEGQTAAHVSYEYILRYNKGDENQQVFITDNFNEATPTEGWTPLVASHKEGVDWATFEKEDVAIPAKYMGKKIRLAFRYNTNAESGSTWEVKNFAIAAGAPGSSEPSTPDTPADGNSITVKASDFGVENNAEVSTITLTNGTTLTFNAGGGSNAPKYFTNGTNVRMYPKNTVTVTSANKKIVKVVLNCDTYNGTICNASGDVAATPGSVNVADAVITITGIDNLSTLITNTSATTGAASQIRLKAWYKRWAAIRPSLTRFTW
uniref:choice-of-anchor J domain-containing protein n=1 Tax=Alloprevotella sp. TaxID=1872471 RepID=UPI003FF04124